MPLPAASLITATIVSHSGNSAVTPLPPKTGISTHEIHVPQLTELRQPEQRPHLEVTLPLPPPPLWPKPLP